MKIDDAILRRIVQSSATIPERLSGNFNPLHSSANSKTAAEKLKLWQAKIASADPSLFEVRLDLMGESVTSVRAILGEVELQGPLPSWAKLLRSVLSQAEPPAPGDATKYPFEPLLRPFVDCARAQIMSSCVRRFSFDAIDSLVDGLANELSQLSAPVLLLEFSVFRTKNSDAKSSNSKTEWYDHFVGRLLAGGLVDLFVEYPVLARKLCECLEDWVENTTDLANAIESDHHQIIEQFCPESATGPVSSIKVSLSDRHNGGRTVSIVGFENGLKLVYKPRNIQVEKNWFEFLGRLNELGGEFRILKVLSLENHGWVEFVEASSCERVEEIGKYYRRAGMLLCVMYALEASDCFFENIIANADYPVLIDMETLMHHVLAKDSSLDPAEDMADELLFNSVFRAGFLPAWETGPNGQSVDISGLNAPNGQQTSYLKRRWENINTDQMTMMPEQIVIDSTDHLPKHNGEPVMVREYVAEVIEGFQELYRLLMDHRKSILGPGGMLDVFSDCEIRFVFHPTRIYGILLKRLAMPKFMRCGVVRSIEVDVISRFYLESSRKVGFRQILASEIRALHNLDIPKFTVQSNSKALQLPSGETLDDAFEDSAFDRICQRIELLDKDDLKLQSEFIRSSLEISSITVIHSDRSNADDTNEVTESFTPEELVKEAIAIGNEIESRVIRSRNGGATWIAPQLLPGANRYEFRPLRLDLYSGLAGLAVFFAALEKVTNTGGDLALAALRPVRAFLKTASPEQLLREGYTLGGTTGVGAFLVTLDWCCDLLGIPVLHDEALEFSRRIPSHWIAEDQQHDLMAGASGGILGFLNVHQATDDPTCLEKAVVCGESLLQNAKTEEQGLSWPASGGRNCPTGFSHGNAGIAAAFARLAKFSGEERFLLASQKAIRFENSTFDNEVGNWPDFRNRSDEKRKFMNTWCHGAPGIGIGRSMTSEIHADCAQDLTAAIRATQEFGIGAIDGLCCGALGRAELFLHDLRSFSKANLWASKVIGRARLDGGYHLANRSGDEFFNPSFFQGLSGIGYQLLRIAQPERLPSILAFERVVEK